MLIEKGSESNETTNSPVLASYNAFFHLITSYMHHPVYHPNAIYLHLAIDLYFVLFGVLLLAASFNKGPFKTTTVTSKWGKALTSNWVRRVISIPCVILFLISLYMDLGKFFSV